MKIEKKACFAMLAFAAWLPPLGRSRSSLRTSPAWPSIWPSNPAGCPRPRRLRPGDAHADDSNMPLQIADPSTVRPVIYYPATGTQVIGDIPQNFVELPGQVVNPSPGSSEMKAMSRSTART